MYLHSIHFVKSKKIVYSLHLIYECKVIAMDVRVDCSPRGKLPWANPINWSHYANFIWCPKKLSFICPQFSLCFPVTLPIMAFIKAKSYADKPFQINYLLPSYANIDWNWSELLYTSVELPSGVQTGTIKMKLSKRLFNPRTVLRVSQQ